VSGNIQTAAEVRCRTRAPSDVRIDVARRTNNSCPVELCANRRPREIQSTRENWRTTVTSQFIRSEAAEPSTMPFAQRLTCTIDDACEVTGLGRTKLYELIGAGRIVTTTIGRRRLVVVRSLLALLDTNMSN
jgi:excisionase family DNA binding protein